MKLLVIGDLHSYAAMATNNFESANVSESQNVKNDPRHMMLGYLPHPNNLKVSWGLKLSELLKMNYEVYASETDADKIRYANEFIDYNDNLFLIMGFNLNNSDVSIFNFHLILNERKINHLFYNIDKQHTSQYDFKGCYMDDAYIEYLQSNGHEPVITSNTYFGTEAHADWSINILKYIVNKGIM